MIRIKTLTTMLASVLIAAFAFAGTNTQSETSAKAPAPLKIGHLIFKGGNGLSIEQAVIIKNAKNESEGVRAERLWIRKIHPGWRKGRQALLSKKGKQYDRIEYKTPNGETKTIFFDISDFFGKF